MTFIGKILVIVIMAVSIVFLGISTVTLTTATDWKAAIKAENEEIGRLNARLTPAKAALADFQARLADAQKQRAVASKAVEDRIKVIQAEDQKDRASIEQASKALVEREGNAKSTLEEVKVRNDEIIKLREQVAAVTEQSRQFKARGDELEAEIVNVRRMLDSAERNTAQISKSH